MDVVILVSIPFKHKYELLTFTTWKIIDFMEISEVQVKVSANQHRNISVVYSRTFGKSARVFKAILQLESVRPSVSDSSDRQFCMFYQLSSQFQTQKYDPKKI